MARLPEAGSAEAERPGTTWDRRAAGLCMSHVLSFWETDGGAVNGGDALATAEASPRHHTVWVWAGGGGGGGGGGGPGNGGSSVNIR